MKVTIKEIAKIAGVHRSTVDKVLHGRKGVSDEVREKIWKIIKEVGYEPNPAGKALAYQKSPLVITVLLLKVDALEEIKTGIEEAYREYKAFGLEIDYYITDNYDVQGQLNVIHSLRDKKTAGLIITPLNDITIQVAIDEIVERGIPVITVNADLPESKRMCFVGQNMLKAGKVAGELMGEILDGYGKVALITDSYDMSLVSKRIEGFEQVMRNMYPNIEMVDIIEIYEQEEIAYQKTLSLLQSVKDLKGIYIACGSVSEVGKAVKVMNKDKQVKIVCFDVYPDIVQLVKEGVINFTIDQHLFDQGYKSVKMMFDYLFFDRKPEMEYMNTPIDIKFKGNIDIV